MFCLWAKGEVTRCTYSDLLYCEKLSFLGGAYSPRHKHVKVSSRCTSTEKHLHTEIEEDGVLVCKHMGVFLHPTHSTVAYIGEGRAAEAKTKWTFSSVIAAEAKIKWTFSSVIAEFLSLETIFCAGRATDCMKLLSISQSKIFWKYYLVLFIIVIGMIITWLLILSA